jgi:hypothetical protein
MANGHNRLRDLYTDHIDNDILFGIEINSREELQEMEKEEFGEVGRCINWSNWDALVQKTKEELEAYEYVKKEGRRAGKPIYAYSWITKELIKKFASASIAAEAYHTSVYTVLDHARSGKPYQDRIFFSMKYLDKAPQEDETIKWVYAFRLDTGELLGRFKTAMEASKHFGFQATRVGCIMNQQGGKHLSKNLYFTYNKNDRPII